MFSLPQPPEHLLPQMCLLWRCWLIVGALIVTKFFTLKATSSWCFVMGSKRNGPQFITSANITSSNFLPVQLIVCLINIHIYFLLGEVQPTAITVNSTQFAFNCNLTRYYPQKIQTEVKCSSNNAYMEDDLHSRTDDLPLVLKRAVDVIGAYTPSKKVVDSMVEFYSNYPIYKWPDFLIPYWSNVPNILAIPVTDVPLNEKIWEHHYKVKTNLWIS